MNFKHTPEEARNLVADALESGNYDQGHSVLHNILYNTWCCLGVATKVYMKHEEHNIKLEKKGLATTFDGNKILLLPSVKEWLGFNTNNGCYIGSSLITDNDTEGMSFIKIAKLFRNPPKGLLK